MQARRLGAITPLIQSTCHSSWRTQSSETRKVWRIEQWKEIKSTQAALTFLLWVKSMPRWEKNSRMWIRAVSSCQDQLGRNHHPRLCDRPLCLWNKKICRLCKRWLLRNDNRLRTGLWPRKTHSKRYSSGSVLKWPVWTLRMANMSSKDQWLQNLLIHESRRNTWRRGEMKLQLTSTCIQAYVSQCRGRARGHRTLLRWLRTIGKRSRERISLGLRAILINQCPIPRWTRACWPT